MVGENWALGESLDALHDMLHGGYGALAGCSSATVLWKDMDTSREALGREETLRFLLARPAERRMFNGKTVQGQIEALRAGGGETYFDIVMQVFSEHPRIEIIADRHRR
jgi:hypothetical protein